MPKKSRRLSSLNKIFDRTEKVFGVHIFGTSGVKNEKFDHAVNVLREYLDNDGNGKADSKKLVRTLRRQKAAMTIFKNENELEQFQEKHEDKVEKIGANLQDLYDDEIITAADKSREFDATIEEVFHLISDYGYSNIFPDAFGLNSDSLIGNLMNKSRGGYFKKVPNKYPSDAYYTYYDKSCDYECQINEYFYWGITSVLGGQHARGRYKQIKDEWRLNTPKKVAQNAPELFNLLTDEQFGLPKILPDGII